MMFFFIVTALAALCTLAMGHSQLTDPQSTAPMTCRMGGDPKFGVDDCPGPCDMRAIEGGYSNFDSPDKPAAVYRRGQKVRMKYSRNNHGPGGFNRFTLVSPDKMMDKSEHEKNAFSYSCWGAHPKLADPDELEEDQYGFDLIGSDGEQHEHGKGYYTTDVIIPDVVPDGRYVLGWAWFGGVGGSIEGNEPQEPTPYGYFSDYWSCSFVEIQGGDELKKSYTPVFNNDMSQFSEEGCMAANDALGVCTYEPCKVTGKYQKPRPFKDGKTPADLTPENFGGASADAIDPVDPPVIIEESPAPGAVDPPVDPVDPVGPPVIIEESPAPSAVDTPVDPVDPPVISEESPAPSAVDTPVSVEMSPAPATNDKDKDVVPDEELIVVQKRSCRCLAVGNRCWRRLAMLTNDYCVKKTAAEDQPQTCKDACCDYCSSMPGKKKWLCGKDEIKAICGM